MRSYDQKFARQNVLSGYFFEKSHYGPIRGLLDEIGLFLALLDIFIDHLILSASMVKIGGRIFPTLEEFSMCNEVLLKTYIFMSKYTVSELCRIIGISRQTFYNHLKGRYEWRPYEMKMLKDLLGLTDEQAALIFMQINSLT